MAWGLQFDGVNDYLSHTPLPPVDSEWEFSASVKIDTDVAVYLFGNTTGWGGNEVKLTKSATQISFSCTGLATTSVNLNALPDPSATIFDLVVTQSVTGVVVMVNGVSGWRDFTGLFITFPSNAAIGKFNTNSNAFVLLNMSYNNGTSDIWSYSADTSSHAAGTPILVDVVAGVNAVGVNMPTDGSAWVDLGGGGITITPATLNNLQTISNVELTQNHVFAVDSISTLQSVSSAELTQQNNLSVNGLLSIQNISNASLSVAGAITVDDVDSLQEITEPTLTQAHILSVDNIETSQSLSNVLLAASGVLEVQGLTQEQVTSNINLIQQYLLGVDGLSQAQTLSNVTLAAEGVLLVDSILSEQTVSGSNLITQVALLVDDITSQQFISVVSFDKGQDIGTVTAAFKESDISVKYGILNITVKFKE